MTSTVLKSRLGLVVALALTAGLAACADSAPAPASAPPPAATAPMPMPMKAMTAHEKTAALQTALNSNGAALTVDGVYGKKTAHAVAGYQKSHGMKATGRADAKTLSALGL